MTEKGVLVVRRIHVVYRLAGAEEAKETVERVHAVHKEHCPIFRSIYKAIDVTTQVKFV